MSTPPSRPSRRRLLASLGALALGRTGLAADAPAAVAAASDLQFAIEDLATQFAAETGRRVRVVLGSSGNFARQIAQGAPFELFMSADEAMVLRLADAGRTLDRGTLYALGRLALVASHSSPLQVDARLQGLAQALRAGSVRRFAIAHPEHAPYGRAARQALEHAGLWPAIQPHLVLGENVSQAAQFALSGNAQGGLVAYSLVLSPRLAAQGRHVLVPEGWHDPLRQRMALLRGAGETARAFYEWLQQPKARATMRRHGFALPGE